MQGHRYATSICSAWVQQGFEGVKSVFGLLGYKMNAMNYVRFSNLMCFLCYHIQIRLKNIKQNNQLVTLVASFLAFVKFVNRSLITYTGKAFVRMIFGINAHQT